MDSNKIKITNDARKVFLKKGTCSGAFFYILNREFENKYENEVTAADVLAGGILRQGYQCGMLWGSALAVGAEAYRKHKDKDQAVGLALRASRLLVKSFLERTKSVECYEITKTDWKSAASMAKYAITGKFMTCFNLSQDWAPEAIEAAQKGLSVEDIPKQISCASEVLKKAGASDEEIVMVAGFAGGLGLSGNGCGALAAAVWYKTLKVLKKTQKRPGFKNPEADLILKEFQKETDYEVLCSQITGQSFETEDDHTLYIKKGGCQKLIKALALSVSMEDGC